MSPISQSSRGRAPGARLVPLAFASLYFLAFAPPASAETFLVNSTRDEGDAEPGDGICATEAGLCTVRAAVDEANALAGPDEIVIPSGRFRLNAGTLTLHEDVAISGAGMERTVLQGNKQVRVVEVLEGVQSEVVGLTIRNGGEQDGAGVYNAGTVHMTNVKITRQRADAARGGGLYNAGTAQLNDVAFLGNAALFGGAIYSTGSLDMADVMVRNNKHIVDGGGAGLYNRGTAFITRSTFIRNQARIGEGGGAILNRGNLEITNSTLSRNRARLSIGGALITEPISVSILRNVTMVRNQARFISGGLANFGFTAVHNSIIAENFNNRVRHINCGGDAILSLGYNLDSGAVCGFHGPGDIANEKPRLRGENRNGGITLSRALMRNSAAVDAGDPASCPPIDQRGALRPVDVTGQPTPRCDIGSFELQP